MKPAVKGSSAFVTRRCLLQGLGVALVGGAAGCATNPVSGRSELMLLSEQEEIELGHKAFGELA